MKPRSLRVGISVAAVVAITLAFLPQAAAVDYLTSRPAGAAAQSTLDYWTAARLASARPMPLPRAASSAATSSPRAPSSSPVRGRRGWPPRPRQRHARLAERVIRAQPQPRYRIRGRRWTLDVRDE